MKLTFYDASGAIKTSLASIPAHTHVDSSTGGQLNAGTIFSAGTVKHEYGGLEADVSAYSGYPKITGGSTSAVTTIPIADGGTGQTGATAAFDALAPTTTKGDVIVHNGTDNIRLAVGANGLALVADSAETAGVKWGRTVDYIVIQDQKAQNTDAGGFTSGAWRTRDLNTEVVDTGSHASISSNQVTLAAGSYLLIGSAPAGTVNSHQTRWQNVTDATTTIVGTTEYASSADATYSRSKVLGYFTIATSKTFELQHQCTTTKATDGLGNAANYTTEVYAEITLFKVA